MIRNNTHAARQLTERELGDRHAAEKDTQLDVQVGGIADLVWKYFEDEIREALAEAQQQLAAATATITTTTMRRPRRGK